MLQAFLAVSWQYQLSNTSVSACGFLAAQIGKAILLDHGTGVVIGETAVIGDRVSMLQVVALRYIYLFESSSLPAFHCMNTH